MIGDFDTGSVVRQLPLPVDAGAVGGAAPLEQPVVPAPVTAVRQLPTLGGFLSPASVAAPTPSAAATVTSDNTSTTTPKLNSTPKTPPTVADKRPTIKMSELPEFTLGQLKALSAYLPKQPGPSDNLKAGYLQIISKQYNDAIDQANGNSDLIRKAQDVYRQAYAPLIAPAAGTIAAVMPGYDG